MFHGCWLKMILDSLLHRRDTEFFLSFGSHILLCKFGPVSEIASFKPCTFPQIVSHISVTFHQCFISHWSSSENRAEANKPLEVEAQK